MAKCPKCSSRKAKRQCPALGEEICPVCCGDGRLRTINCPEDCPHLASEHYQHKRRRERAASRGRSFLETNRELFGEEEAADFAFKLQADVYYFLRNKMTVDDRTVSSCLDRVRGVFSRIFVPQAVPHPLARFLEERLEDRSRYPPESGPSSEDRARILRDLARHVEALGGEGTRRYGELLSSFFDSLDFEADLDYSPQDSASEPQDRREPPRTESGLILPFSSES